MHRSFLNSRFLKFIKPARLNTLTARFWPTDCMFDPWLETSLYIDIYLQTPLLYLSIWLGVLWPEHWRRRVSNP